MFWEMVPSVIHGMVTKDGSGSIILRVPNDHFAILQAPQ